MELPPQSSARQLRELGAFARFCIARLERELGAQDMWIVHIMPAAGGYTCHIAAKQRSEHVEARGAGQDGPLATWDAICQLEQRLRERSS